MTRKHTRRKHVVNPTAWACAIFNSQVTEPAEVSRIMVLLRTAYERLKSKAGTHEDFDRVAAAINVGMIRAEAIDQQLVEMFKAAGEAMLEADRIRERHGSYGFTGPHLLAMNAVMDLYEEVLGKSTPNQMNAAALDGMRRMQRGEVLQA